MKEFTMSMYGTKQALLEAKCTYLEKKLAEMTSMLNTRIESQHTLAVNLHYAEKEVESLTSKLKECEDVKQGYHDALLKATDEQDKLKAEREQMEKQKPVAYVHKDDLAKLQECNAIPMTFIPDSPNCWPIGSGESDPYEWLVALYAHPLVPDGKVLVDTEYSIERMQGFYDAVGRLLDKKIRGSYAWSSDECRELYEAMLKAAQQGDSKCQR